MFKVKLSELKRIVQEEIEKVKEDADRVRRHKDGYGDDLEEDSDRVRRHADGYGDDLEECGEMPMKAPHQEPDGDEKVVLVVPTQREEMSLGEALNFDTKEADDFGTYLLHALSDKTLKAVLSDVQKYKGEDEDQRAAAQKWKEKISYEIKYRLGWHADQKGEA